MQYDQGEDRWLCTLLLKQGWRVEYSAASDSFTACPETFKEFYNQRRRWMPSTLLNIVDLISDYKTVVKNNDDISYIYILYQVIMMVGTVIGPGSIFLMLIGAFNIAFGISNANALYLNAALVIVFVLACCFLKSPHQIMIAQLLTLIYAIVMIAVYVGIALQIVEDGPLSLSALGFFVTFGCFFIAGILHPQEISCLFCIVIYFATIPSMYLLLMIYSLFNLNDVSWGTREVPKQENEKEQAEQVEQAKKAAEKKGGLLGYFETLAESKKKGNIEFSLGNLMSCLCCTTEDQNDTKKELMVMADKLDKIEKALNIEPGQAGVNNGGANGVKKLLKHPTVDMSGTEEQTKEENKEDKKKVKPSVNFADEEPKTKTTEDGEDAWRNPYWIKDTDEMNQKCELLAKSPKLRIPDDEVQFWIDMVKEYLQPDCKAGLGPEEKKKVAEGLKELKNSVALGFVLMNVIWITAIYMLQNQKDMIGIKWPLGEKGPNISWDTTDPERDNIMILQYEYLQLEPVGMVFMIVFIFIIGIQLVGMFFHRLMTLGHIVASTELNLFKRNRFDTEDYLNRHGVEVIKEIQGLNWKKWKKGCSEKYV